MPAIDVGQRRITHVRIRSRLDFARSLRTPLSLPSPWQAWPGGDARGGPSLAGRAGSDGPRHRAGPTTAAPTRLPHRVLGRGHGAVSARVRPGEPDDVVH